jgi:hypothetical protein
MTRNHHWTGMKMIVPGLVFAGIFIGIPVLGAIQRTESVTIWALGFSVSVVFPPTGLLLILGGEPVARVVLIADPRRIGRGQVAFLAVASAWALFVGFMLQRALAGAGYVA